MLLLAFAAALTLAPGRQPQIDAAGDFVALTFGTKDAVHFAASADGGRTFGAPVKVADVPGLMLGKRRGPRIAVLGDTVAISAIDGDSLLAWRSADRGRTWSGPAAISNVPKTAREGLHGMAAGAGVFFATWLDLRDNATKLYGAVSTDGARWSDNFLIYTSPDGHICECCHTSALVGPKGELHVMWRNWLGGSRDMWHAVSTDRGRTWKAEKLGTGTWPLKACPMDGGGFSVDRAGRLQTVWRRDQTVYAAAPGEPERELGPGRDPQIAATANGVYYAWRTAGGLTILPPSGSAQVISDNGSTVSLAGGDYLVAAWEADDHVVVRRLDPPELQPSARDRELEKAHEAYAAARAEATSAELELERVTALYEKGDLPRKRVEDARLKRDAAADAAEAARKRLAVLQAR